MEFASKNMYRAKIKDLASKAKISEVYVAKTLLEMAKKEKGRKSHIGYFLLEDVNALCEKLEINKRKSAPKQKSRLYAAVNLILPLFISFFILTMLYAKTKNLWLGIITAIISYLPISEITIQTINYILRKSCNSKQTAKARL